jgi:hypothetical protein
MKTYSQRTNLWVAAVLFAFFLMAFMPDLTGTSLHQWLGAALGMIAGLHLLSHWTWVRAVSQRFMGRTSNQALLYYVVDAGVLQGFAGISIIGLVISPWGITLTRTDYPSPSRWDARLLATSYKFRTINSESILTAKKRRTPRISYIIPSHSSLLRGNHLSVNRKQPANQYNKCGACVAEPSQTPHQYTLMTGYSSTTSACTTGVKVNPSGPRSTRIRSPSRNSPESSCSASGS